MTREFLQEHGELRYERYAYKGKVWACSWVSPYEPASAEGYWVVYPTEARVPTSKLMEDE